jgi:hypothetical protein
LDDFYNISAQDIKEYASSALLDNCYNRSLITALETVYSNHSWLPWRFAQNVAPGYWENDETHRKFLEWLGIQIGFKSMDDWYNVTQKHIRANGGSGLLSSKYGNSPYKLVMSVYKNHQWHLQRFRDPISTINGTT